MATVRGFVYSDGRVDDARLVVLNVLDAQERGATIHTRVRCESLTPEGGWLARHCCAGPRESSVHARVVVNATGPWVTDFVERATPVQAAHQVRLVKGSHIAVPRLFDHRFAYIFQNEDRRIVFAIPYEHEFTLLGTTDVDYRGDPAAVRIDDAEIAYLCALSNRYFRQQIAPGDVIWSYSGVRPLLTDESYDPMSVTRDYALELDRRRHRCCPCSAARSPPTASSPRMPLTCCGRARHARTGLDRERCCPVGICPRRASRSSCGPASATTPGCRRPLRRRYAHAYGTRITRVLAGPPRWRSGRRGAPAALRARARVPVPGGIRRHRDDILWRRSKLGLHLMKADLSPLERWLAARVPRNDPLQGH